MPDSRPDICSAGNPESQTSFGALAGDDLWLEDDTRGQAVCGSRFCFQKRPALCENPGIRPGLCAFLRLKVSSHRGRKSPLHATGAFHTTADIAELFVGAMLLASHRDLTSATAVSRLPA